LIRAVFYPFFFELLSHIFKVLNWVVSINVVFLEVLHKNKNKQIKHDVLLQKNENYKENDIKVVSTRSAGAFERRVSRCIKHYFMPVFSS
jgi:hypothetical protein